MKLRAEPINLNTVFILTHIGVDRGALIKVWLHERLQQEKAAEGK